MEKKHIAIKYEAKENKTTVYVNGKIVYSGSKVKMEEIVCK